MAEPKTKKIPRKTPDILYHYTSQEGLLGIINGGVIWATDILYLNDATEYTYAYKMIMEELNHQLNSVGYSKDGSPINIKEFDPKTSLSITPSSLIPQPGREGEFKFIQSVASFFIILRFKKNYVCSFSEMGDQLSQWRGYCQDGYGFSIGFDRESLEQQFNGYGMSKLVKCVYLKAQQMKIVESILPSYLEKARTVFSRAENDSEYKKQIRPDMLQCVFKFVSLVSRFKHKKFKEENEWRFVYKESSTIKLRPGKSMLVPYVELPLFALDENENRMPLTVIKEIVVGPTPHPELSLKSVLTLLIQRNIKCTVRLSEVPYRSW